MKNEEIGKPRGWHLTQWRQSRHPQSIVDGQSRQTDFQRQCQSKQATASPSSEQPMSSSSLSPLGVPSLRTSDVALASLNSHSMIFEVPPGHRLGLQLIVIRQTALARRLAAHRAEQGKRRSLPEDNGYIWDLQNQTSRFLYYRMWHCDSMHYDGLLTGALGYLVLRHGLDCFISRSCTVGKVC